MSAFVRVVVKYPGKPAEVTQIGGGLSDMQKIVDGYVEIGLKVASFFGRGLDLLVFVNDEGAVREPPMAPNILRPTDEWPLRGPIFAAKARFADGYPLPMSEDETARVLAFVSSMRSAS